MTLTPFIVALCVNTGATYNEACKKSLEAGAAQSGFAGQFEHFTKKTEQDLIRFITPSAKVEMAAAAIGYTYQVISNKQATLALPNPGIKDSSLSLTIGEKQMSIGLNIGF